MSNQYNIQDLFSKASSMPVEASFDETKELFLATVATGSYTSRSNSSRLFTFKNGLIMLAIVSTIIATLLISSGNENENPKKEINEAVVVQTTTDDTTNSQNVTKEIVIPKMHFTEIMSSVVEYMVDVDSAVTNEVFFADNAPKLPEALPVFELPTHLEVDRPYDFPKLTKKEIEANNKRKKKMVKLLLKRDKRRFVYVPSGSFDYHGTPTSVQAFHMQSAEVSNIEYKTFLFDLLIQGRKDDFLIAKPDQAMWTKTFGDGMKTMKDNYFSHEAYASYPVVNVSRKAAEMYCVWLTTEANKVNEKKGDPMINDVRIPVRPEWELAASGAGQHMPFPWGGPLAQNAKGCFLANYDPSKEGELMDTTNCEGCDSLTKISSDGAMMIANTKTYNPNEYGLFNMSGNVAEMVYGSPLKESGKDVQKTPGTAGGGWMSPFESLKINGKDEHDGLTTAHPNVGFRVVITYLRKKK